jgi:hypothetical protein
MGNVRTLESLGLLLAFAWCAAGAAADGSAMPPLPAEYAARTEQAAGAAGAPAAGARAEAPPPEVPPAAAPAPGNRDEGDLGFPQAANANRGPHKLFADPKTAAKFFLEAVKAKDLNKIAQATALRAATESKNQKLFRLILAQELAQEDLDELSSKLSGFEIAGSNAPKNAGTLGILLSKTDGKVILRRTLTMRHEKAGWKVQDISGEGELGSPIITPRTKRGNPPR